MSKEFYRVTSILSPFNDFSSIPPEILRRACERGNRVHDLCEKYVKGDMVFPDIESRPYFDSFCKWYNSYVKEFYFAEERVWSKQLRLTGKIDLLVKLHGDGYGSTLIDIKTPQSPSLSWNLQTAAYQYLCETDKKIHIARRGCLILDKNGGAARLVEYTDYQESWKIYRGLFDAYIWYDRHNSNPHAEERQDPELAAEWQNYLMKK